VKIPSENDFNITVFERALASGARNLSLYCNMIPDYPHKIFGDKRICYFLLMEALAMEAVR